MMQVLAGRASDGGSKGTTMPRTKLNILVLSDFLGYDANVVRDYLYCFNQHSRHQFYYLHNWSKNNFRRLHGFDFNRFDAIILFWDFFWVGSGEPLSYCYVPDWVAGRIADSSALKVQFLQDEYRDVRLANRAMSRFGVNLMFTCTAEKDHELFYPKSLIPTLQATYPVLTGYVPTYLEHVHYPAEIERPIDIGYRSRKLMYYLGRLGQEKGTIADRFEEIASRHGFSANISVKEKDRIYGEDWLTFMKACRFSIGTESGASVVDFDGQIRKNCQEYVLRNPDASFEEVSEEFFAGVDGKVVVQTISPRIFEAAAFENTLVLHEGHYEGMLQPDVHYISVKKDYSNVDQVVERMKDLGFCQRLARNAKDALINSKKYSYQSFVKSFDETIERHIKSQSRPAKVSRTLFYMMNYVNNDRLLPHRGAFLAIPHSCDVVSHYAKYTPYLLTLWHSIGLILGLVWQAPRLTAAFLQGLLVDGKKAQVSIIGILRDLRILALFFQHRAGIPAPRGPAFTVHLTFQPETNQLVATSVLDTEADSRTPESRLAAEVDLIDRILMGNTPSAILWEHRLGGNSLPLSAATDCSIYLNDDGIYRFESLNRLRRALSQEECDLVKRLIFGGWQKASWFGRCGALLTVTWTLLKGLLYEAPMSYLRASVKQPTSARTPQTSTGRDQTARQDTKAA